MDEADLITVRFLLSWVPYVRSNNPDSDQLIWLMRLWRKHHVNECYLHELLAGYNVDQKKNKKQCRDMHVELNRISGMRCDCWVKSLKECNNVLEK